MASPVVSLPPPPPSPYQLGSQTPRGIGLCCLVGLPCGVAHIFFVYVRGHCVSSGEGGLRAIEQCNMHAYAQQVTVWDYPPLSPEEEDVGDQLLQLLGRL